MRTHGDRSASLVLVPRVPGPPRRRLLGIGERAAEFAVLQATGWSDAHLVRLVLHEGAQLGALGATSGAAAGAALVVWLTGTFTPALAATPAAAALGGVLLTTTAALAPAAALLRLPTAPLLAED
ncbi:hypothetical protein HHL19_22780 [Streptomyces sp. R302]|uniref:FtsX-like permease family protein n=1 Tax=unclassified Streptomyces TaxID=2593676 RepID=UPI00145DBF57|nr:hypothetical protein [Streptomyces sp. R301]NML81396.1 hypothetical protein [Streptomyces sp. R302]